MCPDALNQINQAIGWSRYRGSPDYFHACDDGGLTDVPNNMVGYQVAATGSGYAGVITWTSNSPNNREHFGTMLSEPLQIGIPVYVSFKLSPTTGGLIADHNMIWTASGAGLRFTMDQYLQNQAEPLSNNSAIHMPFVPLDTVNWYQVSGVFVPDSAYEHVVLGNFYDESQVITEILNLNGTYMSAYVYFDDICVSYEAEYCNIKTNLVSNNASDFVVFPNPFDKQITIKFSKLNTYDLDYHLLDLQGRLVMNGSISTGSGSFEVNATSLKAGSYILKLITPMGALPPVVLIRVER